ncbi:CUT2 ABC transporter permease [Pontimonas salivibrio]|uniref:Autoinducer 2 import system permease protein LsrD n=1 Tax=Pontimonas salivibrio TaxID=1159327 RepID=A0A2L2BRK2_9MICO|nr:ABC transporter permease [Pontimonas salivibrio]AVG24289.1 CUT2 ABC transporter permease [Pontimonas salivibrio]
MSNALDMKMDPLWKRMLGGGSGTIWVATILLFAASPVFAPASLSYSSVVGMLPFAAVLAIAAVGQTLVIQQGGLDLSVPGMMALSAALATGLYQWYAWPNWAAIIAAILLPGVAGLLSGIIVTQFRVMSLVVTLGMNAILLGLVFWLADGIPAGAPAALAQFAKGKVFDVPGVFGIPNALIIAAVIIVFLGFIVQRTIIGRRLTAVGVSQTAAAALGVPVNLYRSLAYMGAGMAYGLAGVLYAGYVTTPPLFYGDSYLLPTVAAVVLGGTAIGGGRAAIVSTGVAALFLTQLSQLMRAVGLPEPLQLIAQAGVLLAVVLMRAVIPMISASVKARRTTPITEVT